MKSILNSCRLGLIYCLYGIGFACLSVWLIIAAITTVLWALGATVLFLPILLGFLIEQQNETPAEPYRYDGVANDI